MKRIMAFGATALCLGMAAAWAGEAPAGGPPGGGQRPPTRDTRSADPAQAQSGNYTSEANHSRIIWSVKHNGFSTFMAVLPYFDAKLNLDAKDPSKSTLEVSVPMDKITTGVPAAEFTEQLKGERYFNVAKFPTANFKSTKVERAAPNKARVTGDLTFLGVTKPAVLEATFNQAGEGPNPGYKVGFDGMLTLKRSEFGLNTGVPNVSDDVMLMIEAEFVPAKAP